VEQHSSNSAENKIEIVFVLVLVNYIFSPGIQHELDIGIFSKYSYKLSIAKSRLVGVANCIEFHSSIGSSSSNWSSCAKFHSSMLQVTGCRLQVAGIIISLSH